MDLQERLAATRPAEPSRGDPFADVKNRVHALMAQEEK